ncbi:hypothetical protein BC936DRAFT_147392 [Jimgerdemannia flammicorona]|uniref:Uncharacterized protein n=2 Tax=Jimgerdemannia flammicorona TaxID=994334 RepID=A0A433D5G1_9FUNG|nr:hypothetical protein BC936DRAFT_147392 [Jimgerdemannia flammicorona]RUS34423.1 hypothetical protein BC938DRAFT_480525 [Jimgerdemannia flammicorona]
MSATNPFHVIRFRLQFQRATVTEAGVQITAPYSVETEWGFAEVGYGAQYIFESRCKGVLVAIVMVALFVIRSGRCRWK